MTHPAYLREKALSLRTERHLSVDEIALRLALPKTTIYYWVREIPLGRARRSGVGTPGQRKGNRAMRAKYRLRREAAYAEGRASFGELTTEPGFRDFVCMYIGEGYKRDRNTVSIANSDPRVMVLANSWMQRLTEHRLRYLLQYHADQRVEQLQTFWGGLLGVAPAEIRGQPKTNSGQLRGRVWRCRYGVLSIAAYDTLLRARLQAWMDCVQEQWLDSPASGRGAAW
jgi:hypothetical protein